MKISDIKYIWNRIQLTRKISKLQIEKAGVDSEEIPYVKLKNGPVFYGLISCPKDKKYYNLLPTKLKSILPFESFLIANDIVIRYFEGGLKLGGPRKELFYKTKPGDYIAEMGAYMGHYTIYLSEKVGKNGKVIAIEPMPDNLKILRKNITENNLDNVVIVPKGVWKEKDEMIFHRKKGDRQSGSIELNYKNNDSLKIPVDSLDNILQEQNIKHIDFMLVQLNGVEPEALEGLTNYKPNHIAIASRYSKNNKPVAPIIANVLQERNYKSTIVKRDFVFAELK
ncbi:MAG: FkbM family methyltransferase [Bacteroidales bacterium]|nr:FkbM family methyltransferase [Bacteroidales bacterium]